MAASYPASLPVKDPAGANLSTNPHSTLHDGMYDEIVAIATELGTTPKGTAASVKARLDALPRGVVGYGRTTTAQTGITGTAGSPTDLTTLTATFTAVAGRLYRTSVSVPLSSSADGQIAVVMIRTGTTVLASRSTETPDATDANGDLIYAAGCDLLFTGTGSVTHKASMYRRNGAGTVASAASATNPAHLIIEDVGPS